MHWLPRSVGRKRVGKFKHAGIFLHDPVEERAGKGYHLDTFGLATLEGTLFVNIR